MTTREIQAEKLWARVPPSGQADSVQAELMRALVKLRDEAQRNGNVNFGDDHVALAKFLGGVLTGWDGFDDERRRQIELDVRALLDCEHPPESPELYRRMLDGVLEFAAAHPDPIPHPGIPGLRI